MGIERIDFHHPAKGVWLVAVIALGSSRDAGCIEALEFIACHGFPSIAAGAPNAVAAELTRKLGVGSGEIAGPVFLASEVGSHGVNPLAQLLRVPRAEVPLGL